MTEEILAIDAPKYGIMPSDIAREKQTAADNRVWNYFATYIIGGFALMGSLALGPFIFVTIAAIGACAYLTNRSYERKISELDARMPEANENYARKYPKYFRQLKVHRE